MSYLQAEIDYIQLYQHYQATVGKDLKSKSKKINIITKMRWTANKIDLVELIYALHRAKCINNGDVDIKDIVEAFGQLFNIDLGKYSRTYVDVVRRKICRPKFLSKLLKALESILTEKDSK